VPFWKVSFISSEYIILSVFDCLRPTVILLTAVLPVRETDLSLQKTSRFLKKHPDFFKNIQICLFRNIQICVLKTFRFVSSKTSRFLQKHPDLCLKNIQICLSKKHPDLLWCPPSLLYSGYHGFFPKVKRWGGGGSAVVEWLVALRYKPEGCGFDFPWCHWNLSLTPSLRPHYVPGIDSPLI
jgi:hypothetical protein